MVVQADRVGSAAVSVERLTTLARALESAAARTELSDALGDLANAIRLVSGADVALLRVGAEVRAVAAERVAKAELEGLRRDPNETAARLGADAVLVVPADELALEVYRSGAAFSRAEELAVELAASHAGLLLRAFGGAASLPVDVVARPALELAGDALAAALDEANSASEIVRVAATVAGASAGILWERDADGALEIAGSHGLDSDADLDFARRIVERSDDPRSLTIPLGHPPVGLMQLIFRSGERPGSEQVARLSTFGVRAAHALRASTRARNLAVELARTRTLLAVVGQATAELSLDHTLATAIDRVTELLAHEQVAVYLRGENDRLVTGASRGLAGPHERVAEQLLDAALGSALVEVVNAAADVRLVDVRDAVREAGIEAAIAVPLRVRNEVVGLLALYPRGGSRLAEHESALLPPLAALLAVAVQNAQLHERATELGRQRESALASERQAARRLGALYEISRSFAQSLSLEATLDALAATIVDVLDVDAAVIRMPDERREQIVPRAMYVKDEQLDEAARAILFRPQALGGAQLQRLFRDARPFRISRRRRPGGTELLEPFLSKGWTAAVVPVATPAEVVASLSILSFRPGNPIEDETIEAAVAIAGQAALAIDNARLYQHQKEFADTMQRSLLPREQPEAAGLEIGQVYESSARVEVGGDVYDFVGLDDGRLAVVLGDVTGHGVEATADMAMAKFVFRSLAREHPEPGDFLAAANDVVVGEIATGKFITMAYLVVDGKLGEVACASAGHPAPRIVLEDGTVSRLEAEGLVLGIDPGQRYEEVRTTLPPGASLVVYTDGVIEARREGTLYGTGRLDALLAERRGLPPAALARAIADDAREFAGGELSDDLAVVVIRRV